MSFKCSIFGHNYGDSEVEREREEEGSEVVITVRETETCARCGETRVVSENKEVTTLETAADIVAEDLEETDDKDESARDETTGHNQGHPTDTAGAPAAESTQAERTTDHTAQPTDHPSQSTGHENEEPPIPEAESESHVESTPDASEDDGVILDEEETETHDDREPGEWPEEPDDDDEDDWKPETDIDPQPGSDRRNVESTGSAVTVPDGEFQCPECGFTTAVESSSLREGDFCPDCHQGALEHKSE
jgi:hypothetical protein